MQSRQDDINALHERTVASAAASARAAASASAAAGQAVQEDAQARSIMGRMLDAVTTAVVGAAGGTAAAGGTELTVAVAAVTPSPHKRQAQASPSDADLTDGILEGFDWSTDANVDNIMHMCATMNGGDKSRPSREKKKVQTETAKETKTVQAQMLDEAAMTWKQQSSMNVSSKINNQPVVTLLDVVKSGLLKFKRLHPHLPLVPCNVKTVTARVRRNALDASKHKLTETRRGPTPPLEEHEKVLIGVIKEFASAGFYYTITELRAKMSELIAGTPAEEKYAKLAMKARGGTVLEPCDLIPGDRWARQFLKRHQEAVESLVPDGLDVTREAWQNVDTFRFWYHAMGKVLLREEFCVLNPKYANVDFDSTEINAAVFAEDEPLMFWLPGRQAEAVCFDETSVTLCMEEEANDHNSHTEIVPKGDRGQQASPKSSNKCTLIVGVDMAGGVMPPVVILPGASHAGSPLAKKQYGENPFVSAFLPDGSPNPARHPFLNLTSRFTKGEVVGPDGKKKEITIEQKYEGKVYCSDKGGVNADIMCHFIENVWAPCFKPPSERKKVLILFDAYQSHWEAPVLDCMKKHGFVGMIGVPNATGLWQLADVYHNGVFKIVWPKAKRILLKKNPATRGRRTRAS